MLLIYCQHLIQLASNANDGLKMLLHLFSTPVDQMPRRYCKIIESRCLILNLPTVLGKALVLSAIRRRYENSSGLHVKIINSIRRLGRPEPDNFIANTGSCFKSVKSTAHYKIKQKRMDNKLKTKCSKCLKFVCKQHQAEVQFVCGDCEK